jgi:hypothetical protein
MAYNILNYRFLDFAHRPVFKIAQRTQVGTEKRDDQYILVGNTISDMSFLTAGTMQGYSLWGRAIAQAVSRRLSTAAARVRAQLRSCEICGAQSGTGAGFLRVLRVPLSSFLWLLHIHHVSCEARTIVQLVADIPSGLSLTPTMVIQDARVYYNFRDRQGAYVCFMLHTLIHNLIVRDTQNVK